MAIAFFRLRIGPSADEVLKFAEKIVAHLAADHPKHLTVEHSIAARGDRVYLDAFRNGAVQTVVSPCSVRRRPHAPVSTSLAWSEVKPFLDPASFNLRSFRMRLRKKDPWSEFFKIRQTLRSAWARLKEV
jgi:bifunctional non-homologous end joining protein LigD